MPSNSSKKRPDWSAIEFEFVHGTDTYEQLAEKHGIKPATMRQRGARHNWPEKRHAKSQAVTQAASEKLVEERIDELAEFNADDLKMAKSIRGLVARSMQAALDAKTGRVRLSPNDLAALARAADTAQKIGRLALGASTENTRASTTLRKLEPLTDEDFLG